MIEDMDGELDLESMSGHVTLGKRICQAMLKMAPKDGEVLDIMILTEERTIMLQWKRGTDD